MKPLAKACAIALTAAVGFSIGRAVHSPGEAATDPTPKAAAKAPISALPKSLRDSRLSSWRGMMQLDHTTLSKADWKRLLDDTRGDPFLSEALVRRWASIDPNACWEYLIGAGNGWPDTDLAQIAIQIWAGRDPEKAIAALGGLDVSAPLRERERSTLVSDAMEAAMLFDLDRGFALLPTAKELKTNLMFSEEWMQTDPERVCKGLAKFLEENPGNFTRTAGRAAGVWYRADPEAALAWAQSQPHDTRAEALDKIADEMAEAGDWDRLQAVMSTVDSMMILQRVGAPLRRHLQTKDPALACQWVVETFDGRMMGALIRNIIGTTSNDEFSPERYVPYFAQIPEGLGKGEAAVDLLRRWIEVDVPAAADWASGLEPQTAQHMSGHVIERAASNPAARGWLRSAPPSRFADSMLRYVVRGIKTPARAREFAATLPAGRAAKVEEMLQHRAAN
jgi:hypothetical protein